MAITIDECEFYDIRTVISTAVEDSIAYAAEKSCIDRNKAVAHLKDITSSSFEYFIYNLAKCLATSLAQVDANVEEAYVVGMDAAQERTRGCPLILLLVVNKQTLALRSIVEQINEIISGTVRTALSLGAAPAVLLDIVVMEKADTQEKRGLSAVINSQWSPAIKLFG